MQTIFLDTNIFVRYFARDDECQFQECVALFQQIEYGLFQAVTSSQVCLELFHVATKIYKTPSEQALLFVREILQLRQLRVIERTPLQLALELHQQTGVKLSDCVIATQVPERAILCTYDRDFQKFPGLVVKTPAEVVNFSS